MKKPYLLIVGEEYYPSSGVEDWVKCFESYEEARQAGEEIKNNNNSDWYEVVDLRDWAENE